ncbi:MAG TPA: tetratricopeptide repeat protein [Chitinophagaceae bacterium]|nr:tetratricopeptide repeat protein [Chitinophagaceae bacterium]
MKRPQWITIGAGVSLVLIIFLWARFTPLHKKLPVVTNNETTISTSINSDSILEEAKKRLTPEQVVRINTLEHSISRGDVKDQQIKVYQQLAHFWADSVAAFESYAWYEAEAARLENSEKSLTFAAHLFLDNLESEGDPEKRKWKALQAKDLFERSLKLNPENDSSIVGLGACYLFGGISAMPMEGIMKIKSVLDKDSTNVYALMTMAKGSLMSGQYDKAIDRLESVNRIQPDNLEAIMILADTYERMNDKKSAIGWYQKSLKYINRQDVKAEVEKRIVELKK